MQDLLVLAQVNTIVGTPTENVETGTSTAPPSDEGTATQPQAGGFGMQSFLILMLVWIAIIYFFSMRPEKKKEKQLQEVRNSLLTGDAVVTSSGMFGKIVGHEDEAFVIEFGTNKGIRIPVRKSDVFPARMAEQSSNGGTARKGLFGGLFGSKSDAAGDENAKTDAKEEKPDDSGETK